MSAATPTSRRNADLISKARFYQDPNFPDRKQGREQAERATILDTSVRLQGRFAVQTMLLQCMQEQRLDALVSPMSTVPPRKLTSPREPGSNGRTPIGWSLIGQQGFPVITVPGWLYEDRVGSRRRGQQHAPRRACGGCAARWRRFHRPAVRRAAAVQNRVGVRGGDEASQTAS